eukprot:TRINITY_DN10885_c0_g4_i1.p1 TRINITY_DN10885_c0_g4~~TRINITY_DN10885_c0_g4_i1.p1  ORF type:complete len:303 (-),score=40.20 TRINITY_DN10885_c0_g4_i1:298-1206(-)
MIQLIVNSINLFLEINLMMNSWNPDLMWHAWIGLGCCGIIYLYHTWRSRILVSLNEEKPRKFISRKNGIVSQLSLESTWLSMGVSFFCFCVGLIWWHEEYQMVTRHRTEYYVTHGFIAALYAYCIVFQIGFARVIKTNTSWYSWFIVEKSHFRASFLPIVQSTDERINSSAAEKRIELRRRKSREEDHSKRDQPPTPMELHRPSVDSILLGRLHRRSPSSPASTDGIARSQTSTEYFLRQMVAHAKMKDFKSEEARSPVLSPVSLGRSPLSRNPSRIPKQEDIDKVDEEESIEKELDPADAV